MPSLDDRVRARADTVALVRDGGYRVAPAEPVTVDDITELLDDPDGRAILSLVGVTASAEPRRDRRTESDVLGRWRWSISGGKTGDTIAFVVDHVPERAAADLVIEWLRPSRAGASPTRLVVLAGSADPEALRSITRLSDELRTASIFVILLTRHRAEDRPILVGRCAAGVGAPSGSSPTEGGGKDEEAGGGRLIAAFAHHLNNLLTPVVGLTALARSPGSAAEVADDLRVLAQSTDALSDLGYRLRAIAGGTFTRPERVLANAVVQRALDRAGPVPSGNVVVTFASGAADLAVLADPTQLETALVEILQNAIDAVTEHGGGCVEVSVEATRAFAAGARAEEWLAIEVTDDGPGLDDSAFERAFDPFFTTRHGRRGLGLPVARSLLRQMGATVDLQCPPSKGTVVTVNLPLAR